MTGFYLTFDGALNTMDGADVSDRLSQDFIIGELANAEVSLVNSSESQQAVAVVSLVSNQGRVVDSTQVFINANGRFADTVINMFPGSKESDRGYLNVVSSVGLAATEVFGVTNVYTAALNGIETSGGGKTLYSPQYAVGGGQYKTILTLINLESSQTPVTLQLLGDNGVQFGQAFSTTLVAKERRVLADPGIFGISATGPLIQGYVRIVSTTTRVAGYVRFGDPADAQFQAALPLVSQASSNVVYSQVAQDATFFTGVAIINADPANTANVAITVFRTDGTQVAAGSLTIAANNRFVGLLSDTRITPNLNLPSISSGYFRVTSNRPVFSFGLFGTNTLSVLAAVPPQALTIP
jgi:hypothetical protein